MSSNGYEQQAFGSLPDGSQASRYTLSAGAVTATFSDYGARLVSVQAPDRNGRLAHVVLGFETVETYVADKTFGGAVVGRCANRIARGRFTLDGVEYHLPLNNGPNSLHGGPAGFDRKIWQTELVGGGVEFTLVSPDGDMGYPGTLTAKVRYTLVEVADGAALTIAISATTDAPTVVNLANHAYFNLAGDAGNEPMKTVLDFELEISAAHFTPTDATLIPTGELAAVAGTPFDFRQRTRIGDRIEHQHPQLESAGGYDHNWVFGENGVMKLAARLVDPRSGRRMTVETTEPGMQFYSGNFLVGGSPSRGGGTYSFRTGLCLETQHYPDSPNHPEFPSVVLRPGETMRSTTVFTFGVEG